MVVVVVAVVVVVVVAVMVAVVVVFAAQACMLYKYCSLYSYCRADSKWISVENYRASRSMRNCWTNYWRFFFSNYWLSADRTKRPSLLLYLVLSNISAFGTLSAFLNYIRFFKSTDFEALKRENVWSGVAEKCTIIQAAIPSSISIMSPGLAGEVAGGAMGMDSK